MNPYDDYDYEPDYQEYVDPTTGKRISYESAHELARVEREQQQRAEARVQAEKRARVDRGETKVCSECDKERPHDLNDYMCIACRDGEGALPARTYPMAA